MRLLLVKWRQILCSPCFFLSAVVTAVLCFTTELETDTGESTVFEILLSFLMQKDAGLQEFRMSTVLNRGLGTYVILFLPIFAALPCVLKLCLEYRSGMQRYKVIRRPYVWDLLSDCFGLFMSAGSVTAAGYIFYIVLCSPFFRGKGGAAWGALLRSLSLDLGCLFLFGMVVCVPVLLLLPVCRNEYILVTVPFVLFFIQMTAARKFFMQGGLLGKLNVYAVSSVPDLWRMGKEILPVMVFHVCCIVLSVLLYVMCQKRRQDYGQ